MQNDGTAAGRWINSEVTMSDFTEQVMGEESWSKRLCKRTVGFREDRKNVQGRRVKNEMET